MVGYGRSSMKRQLINLIRGSKRDWRSSRNANPGFGVGRGHLLLLHQTTLATTGLALHYPSTYSSRMKRVLVPVWTDCYQGWSTGQLPVGIVRYTELSQIESLICPENGNESTFSSIVCACTKNRNTRYSMVYSLVQMRSQAVGKWDRLLRKRGNSARLLVLSTEQVFELSTVTCLSST